jgi:hypothetical protein
MREQRFIGIFLVGGFLVWALHLAAVYALTSLACTPGFEHVMFAESLAIAVVTIVSLVADAVLISMAATGRGLGEPAPLSSLWRFVAATAAVISAIAVIWQALPGFIVPSC